MNTSDPHGRTLHIAENSDPVATLLAQQSAEVAALRTRLRDLEAALDLPARPGRPAPPTLSALLGRVAALERRAGLVPGLDPLPALGQPARDRVAPAAVSRTRGWWERLPAAGALVGLMALLLWLGHPSLPAGRGRDAATGSAAPAVSTTVPPAGQPASTQGYDVPGPFDFREDHRQGFVQALPGETDAPVHPTTHIWEQGSVLEFLPGEEPGSPRDDERCIGEVCLVP
ncbi:MAG: hypothetical protein ACTHMP_25300 [Thermomicrobiales bacterium]